LNFDFKDAACSRNVPTDMDKEKVHCSSYWTRRRHIRAQFNAFCNDEDSGSQNAAEDQPMTFYEDVDTHNSSVMAHECNASTIVDEVYDEIDDDVYFSSSESDDDDDDVNDEISDAVNDYDLKSLLAAWAIKYQISQVAVNALLLLLHFLHPQLPLDVRTLLATPRQTLITSLRNGGQYMHLGIKYGIEQLALTRKFDTLPKHLKLQFNVDGLPLFRSSGMCIWPILCLVRDLGCNEPFIVGIYCGSSKPNDLNAFFEQFVAECKSLVSNGLTVCNELFTVELNSFVCDAPARAMVKNIKGHSGYFGCDKCKQEGEWHGKVTFPLTNAPLRNDLEFDEMIDEEHHLGPSPLQSLPLGLVTGFPLDYMHLVCLGVMRRMLLCWVKGPLSTRLGTVKANLLSTNLISLIPHIPREFSRKPRSLVELLHWKATELRQFSLYTGPVALQNVLSAPLYEHFLLLSVGISLLINPKWCVKQCEYSKNLLITFVNNMKILYGSGMMVYNVHGLVHLADDVRIHGPLDGFSAFPYENKLKSIKRLVRKPSDVLQQIARRLSEERGLSSHSVSRDTLVNQNWFKKQHTMGPLTEGLRDVKQYAKVKLDGYYVSTRTGDNCVAIKESQPCLVRNIVCQGSETYVIVEFFSLVKSLFESPLPSSLLCIFKVQGLMGVFQAIPVHNITHKCVCLPLQGDASFAVFPLIHSI
jgi:hypothetical protein